MDDLDDEKLKEKIDMIFTPDFVLALDTIRNTKKHILITGKAGTGKSTFLNYLKKRSGEKTVFLAPTGIAALNIGGQTVHRFFRFGIDTTPEKIQELWGAKREIYEEVDTIVIDEVSMLRADLLDCVDKFMRINGKDPLTPFGGARMVFIGDLYQLPPVYTGKEAGLFNDRYKSAFFFDADVMQELDILHIEFEKIFRQSDPEFIEILNAVRTDTATDEHLQKLNSRRKEKPELGTEIVLTSLVSIAERINEMQMEKITTRPQTYTAYIFGRFDPKLYPTSESLELKEGCRIMMLNNEPDGLWVNGTMGTVSALSENEPHSIKVKLDNDEGRDVVVSDYKWDVSHHIYNPVSKKIETVSDGSFAQLPVKLAYALTIHKSQGSTFKKMYLDLSGGIFASGQLYVALSRCRSLEGISLSGNIQKWHIKTEPRVNEFFKKLRDEKNNG